MKTPVIVITATIICLVFFSFLAEWGTALLFGKPSDAWLHPSQPVINVMQPNALDNYGHTLENFEYVGASPWEPSSARPGHEKTRIRTSKFGFFTDHPVDAFPKKTPNEFRIILMGGSGAQGHGASSNEEMLHKKLENRLNADLVDTGNTVRVINMAMAGGHAFTNARQLNLFAQDLRDVAESLSQTPGLANTFAKLGDGYESAKQKTAEKSAVSWAFQLVGERGFEPPAPTSRT